MKKLRHKNIPFFIPHCGCRNNCVFCNQTKITGYVMQDADIEFETKRLRDTVLDALKYSDNADMQIAFFGGSFTGIEPKRMTALLETAYEFVRSGQISGIRLSTRPDYINTDIINLLLNYGVTNIELGMQSTDEAVLNAAGRGHGRQVCFDSAKLITESGITLGGQMMIGLPMSTAEKELATAKDIIAMGASEARIYPTVVFTDTALYESAVSGNYIPITNEEAVERSTACLALFMHAGVNVLRVGLHSSEELKNAAFGAKHPSIGEMTYSRLAYNEIASQIGDQETERRILTVFVPFGQESIVSGQRATNKSKLMTEYGFKQIKIYGTDTKNIKVKIEAED